MTEQYLIAHKVRGEPAFDIAEQIEVNGEVWWIIPTSGHRAYPWWSQKLINVDFMHTTDAFGVLESMPENLPEHYEVSAAPKGKGSGTSGRDLLELIGLAKPLEPMTRRSW